MLLFLIRKIDCAWENNMAKETVQFVKESNVIARARINPKTISVWEERIIAILASQIRTEDIEFKEQLVDVSEFPELDRSRSQHEEIRKSIERLVQSYFEVETANGMKAFPIFAMLGYENGQLLGKFNPQLKEHFLTLHEQFALRSLPEFRRLSGVYSQQIFRFLNSWKNAGSVEVSIKELHDFLMSPPSFKSDFRSFRTRVLESAHAEITEKTSLQYTWEPIRKGLRKVDAIRFSFGGSAIAAESLLKKKSERRTGKIEEIRSQMLDISGEGRQRMHTQDTVETLRNLPGSRQSRSKQDPETTGSLAATPYFTETHQAEKKMVDVDGGAAEAITLRPRGFSFHIQRVPS
jgi:plasmid replication initiation protein